MRTALALALIGLAAGTVLADVPAGVPKPRLRPPRPEAVEAPAAIPIPRLRPPDRDAGSRPDQEPPPAAATTGWPAPVTAEARARCRTLLTALDIAYEPLAPIGSDGACGAPAPISVTRIAGVRIDPAATLTCDMAAQLHGWIAGTVQPAAQRRLKTRVTEIHAAASYVCRLRNNARSGKLSEHGRANALDMSGFSFARSAAVAVKDDSWGTGLLAAIGLSRNGSFLEDVRQGACSYFTTVLGPGSDPYHGDHFHVDALQRKGGYRICK